MVDKQSKCFLLKKRFQIHWACFLRNSIKKRTYSRIDRIDHLGMQSCHRPVWRLKSPVVFLQSRGMLVVAYHWACTTCLWSYRSGKPIDHAARLVMSPLVELICASQLMAVVGAGLSWRVHSDVFGIWHTIHGIRYKEYVDFFVDVELKEHCMTVNQPGYWTIYGWRNWMPLSWLNELETFKLSERVGCFLAGWTSWTFLFQTATFVAVSYP